MKPKTKPKWQVDLEAKADAYDQACKHCRGNNYLGTAENPYWTCPDCYGQPEGLQAENAKLRAALGEVREWAITFAGDRPEGCLVANVRDDILEILDKAGVGK